VKAAALGNRDWTVDARGRGVVVADRQRLTEALMQLAENATKHTKAGDAIAIGTAVADGQARLWVRDVGAGIPAGEQPRVFTRFSRGSGDRRADGAGLGLAIVQAIAAAHHGRVELESREGAGSTFTVVIPVDQPEGARA